jgi:hypothetical protein
MKKVPKRALEFYNEGVVSSASCVAVSGPALKPGELLGKQSTFEASFSGDRSAK